MDYPYFENVWLSTVSSCIGRNRNNFFPMYISKMRLKGFAHFTFKDSVYTPGVTYEPVIEWDKIPIKKDDNNAINQ